MKFILVPIGSAGDVHPLVWLGKLLRARGHEVLMVAQRGVADMPQRAGLPTRAWGDPEEQERIIRDPDIWHPRRAFGVLTRYIPKWAGETLDVLLPEVEPGRTVLIGGALAFGARVLAEKSPEVPLLTVHLQPSIFMSIEESPVMVAGAEWLPRSPRWVRRGFFGMANWMADRKLGPVLEEVRSRAGVHRAKGGRRIRGIMRHYWHSPDGVLCLFPEWYARKARDWPRQAVLTRFPLYDESDARPIDTELKAFVKAGPPPVVITPGSANAHAERFLRVATEACRRVGRRVVIVTRFLEQVPGELMGEDMRAAAYVPFGRLFLDACAVIHHGGIGTTAQCLAAGVPQLIMPLSHDQPDNAARVRRLGVGEYVYPRKFRTQHVAEQLRGVLGSERVREHCIGVKRRMGEQMSEPAMASLVEMMAEQALRVRQINGPGVPA